MHQIKRALIGSVVASVTLLAAIPAQTADVGVSITMGQPGFYGRIDIGDLPHPDLLFPQPIIVTASAVRPPIYLNVPPGHSKNWSKHCSRYNACGDRVFFVRNQWYDTVYVPHYEQRRVRMEAAERAMNNPGKGHDKDKGKGKPK